MQLNQAQFKTLLAQNKLILSFVGMSNIGKTYWSQKLSTLGFQHLDCDALIEKKLAPVLTKLGYAGIADVSRWMGQPYEAKFQLNQKTYLSFEQEVVKNILKQVQCGFAKNVVIDTTGSIVHLDPQIAIDLKKNALVVYLQTSLEMQAEMFQKYLENPKPVVFGDFYQCAKKEDKKTALGRCYCQLLDSRSKMYAKMADVILPYEKFADNLSVNQFISLIQKSL